MSKEFLTQAEVEHIISRSQDNVVRGLFSSSLKYEQYTYIPCNTNHDILEIDDIPVGCVSKGTYTSVDGRLNLLSLNCEGFGRYDLKPFYVDLYNKRKQLFLDYIDKKQFRMLHLQDCGRLIIPDLQAHGYSCIWIPNLISSEGNYADSPNTGLLTAIRLTKHDELNSVECMFHADLFPRFSRYNRHGNDTDLLNCGVSLKCTITIHNQQITLVNIYNTPFSRQTTRISNIIQSLKPLQQTAKTLLTGDLNLYGISSLAGPFGLPASPWAFVPCAAWSMVTGRNIPNIRERKMLDCQLEQIGFITPLHHQSKEHSISIPITKAIPFAPKVHWLLDLPIHSGDIALNTHLEIQPFGSWDHHSLVVGM